MDDNAPLAQTNQTPPETEITVNPFVFTCGAFAPGQADAFCASLTDEAKRNVCEAEMAYYRGQPERSAAISRELRTGDDPAAAAGAFLMEIVTALYRGDTDFIFDTLRQLDAAKPFIDAVPQLKKTTDFFLLYFNILAHNREGMRFPEVSVKAFAVPEALTPMAIYAYAHYLIVCGDYGRAIGLAESTLIQMRDRMPVAEIYLSIIISVGYICRSEWSRAEYYFNHAWETARPDGIYMPFVEHKGMLSGMLERCVRHTCPEEYKVISALFQTYHKNWVKVHNSLTGENVTDKLTGTELNVAMLASKGLSNTEIGDFLSISVNSVRSHLRNIFSKLGITNRKELGGYVIK